MAIDKNKTRELIAGINEFFEAGTGNLPGPAREFLKKSIMGPAFEVIENLLNESRPPVLFLIGRSGHGKSSVINALAGKNVSEVGDIKPTTPESVPYLITFEEQFSTWQVIDSRGIFETTRPDGAPDKSALDLLREDLIKHRPDVIMHVISTPEIRNLEMDLRIFRELAGDLKAQTGVDTPAIIVLNKADTLGNPREWPPEAFAQKAALVGEALNYMCDDVLKVEKSPLNLNFNLKGYTTKDQTYLGVVPVCSLENDHWNIDSLSDFIGSNLPDNALLNYYQALRRKEQLRKISSTIINRFAIIASGIGASPTPFSDFFVITPLQLLLITIVGGLSCRPVSKDTAYEYLSAAGINVLASSGFRMLGQQLLKFIPVAGWAAAGGIAGSGTYALGKAAEAYFFAGELKKPEDFKGEWDKIKNLT